MFLIIHETYRYVLMGACRRSPTSLGHVEALCNAEATSSITDQERAMEEKIHQSSFLKRQELRGVLAERSRSLQASERCREEELRQEAKIRLDYDIDVAKLVYDLDLKGKDESEVAQAVAQARKREGPVCALSTDVLESVRRRRVGVKLSETGTSLQKDLQDISELLTEICAKAARLAETFPQSPGSSSDSNVKAKLTSNRAEVEGLRASLTIPCIARLLLGKNPALVRGAELVQSCRTALDALDAAAVRAAEEARQRAEAEQKALQAAEARELAQLQRSAASKEKEAGRRSTCFCSFQLPYIKEKDYQIMRASASFKAKVDRGALAVSSAGRNPTPSASASREAAIANELGSIAELLAGMRASPLRPVGSPGGRVCSHDYCAFVLTICEKVDLLIKQVAADTALASPGDTITYILYTLFETGVIGNLLAVDAEGACGNNGVTLSENELQLSYTYAYFVFGIYKLLGDNLKKLFGQIIQCVLHGQTTVFCPNFSQWADGDVTALALMIKPPIDANLLSTTKRTLFQKSSKLVTFHGALLRFNMNSVVTLAEALVWFIRGSQQLLLMLNIDHISTNAVMAAVIIEHCCHVLKQFCFVEAEMLLEHPKLKPKLMEYGHEVVKLLSAAVGKLTASVSTAGNAVLEGSVAMIAKCVEVFVQDVLSKVLALDIAVLTKFSGSNFIYSVGSAHILTAYGLISSVKKFEALVTRLDTTASPQEQQAITEVIKADQLDGSIMNQLGPSPASQERVLSGITETLARSMQPGLSSEMLEYTLFKVAHVAVKQSATPFFLAAKHAVPLARVVCSLCKSNPMICDLVVAQFYINCPLALPNVLDCDWKTALLLTIPVAPGAPDLIPRDSNTYAKACKCLTACRFDTIVPKDLPPGQNPVAKRFETRDKFMTRMLKIFSTFCYIMVQPEATPLGPVDAWKWLSNFVKDCLR